MVTGPIDRPVSAGRGEDDSGAIPNLMTQPSATRTGLRTLYEPLDGLAG